MSKNKTKVCTKCKEEKEITEFGKSSKSKDGTYSLCRICNNERTKEYYKNNKEKINNRGKLYIKNNIINVKICYRCKEEKELTEFGNRSSTNDGLSYLCKKCNNERGKKYSEENRIKYLQSAKNSHEKHREKRLEHKREYSKNNREKTRKYRKIKRKNDPIFKLKENVRSRIWKYLKKLKITKKNKTFE